MTHLLAFLLLHPLLLLLFALGTKWPLAWKVGLPLDVVLNFTTAAVVWGYPAPGVWTISKRLKHQQFDAGWRGSLAGKLTALLNKVQPGHI